LSREVLERVVGYVRSLPPPPKLSRILNREIDRLLHPLARESKVFVVADTLAHMVVEQADALVESVYKAIRYNAEKLLGGRCERSG
jgi:ABC-type ATPase with predicted acetyltransferase domain